MTTQEAAMRKALEALENGNRSPITTAANILRTALAQQGEPSNLLGEIIGCFDAAIADGLYEAIAETNDGRLKDLLERRVMHAYVKAIGPDTSAPAPQQDGTLINEGTKSAPAPQPAQDATTGCACRWDTNDNRVATCVRHQGWLDVVSEWADRAKAAEAAQANYCSAAHSERSASESLRPSIHCA